MPNDAGFREVFRGDFSSVELAAALLEEQGIDAHIRYEQAGGTQVTGREAPLLPGRSVVLMVPSIAYDEAKEYLEETPRCRGVHPDHSFCTAGDRARVVDRGGRGLAVQVSNRVGDPSARCAGLRTYHCHHFFSLGELSFDARFIFFRTSLMLQPVNLVRLRASCS